MDAFENVWCNYLLSTTSNYQCSKITTSSRFLEPGLAKKKIKSTMLLMILLLTWCFVFEAFEAISCDESHSCAFTALDASETENIECNGFRSCINSPGIKDIYGGYIECGGSHSCMNSESLLLSDESFLLCYGLKSCANVKNISTGYIECSGQESCANSNIDIVNMSPSNYRGIICDGYLSCKNSIIIISNSIYEMTGYLSAYNASIMTHNDVNNTRIRFAGYYSGYKAHVICGQGQTCYIDCEAGGCTDLTLECENNTTNCTLVTSYTFTIDDYWSMFNQNNITNDILDMIEMAPNTADFIESESNLKYTNDIAVFNMAEKCDDYMDCINSEINDSTIIPHALYCRASQSCVFNNGYVYIVVDLNDLNKLNDSTQLFEYNSIYNNSNMILKCDGFYSCRYIDKLVLQLFNTSTMDTSNVYAIPIVFGGSKRYWSEFQATSLENRYNESNVKFNVYCNALYSCSWMHFTNVTNIYGFGYSCMSYATINTVHNNIYLYTQYVCQYCDISA